MAIKIDSLEVDIKTSAKSAVPAIEALAKSLKTLRKATEGSLGLGKMANQLRKFTETLQKTDFATVANNAKLLGKELSAISARIAGINGKKLSDLSRVIKVLATSANNLSTKAIVKKALEEIDQEAKNAKGSVKKLNQETGKIGIFGKLGKSLKKSAGGLLSSIGRVAFYRAIRSALKAITNAIKEGTTNLYQYGKAGNSSFVKAMDSMATSVQYLKNGLAVGLAPIIQAITPIIVSAADAMAEFGNAISEAFANANNQPTFTKAVKSFKEYQEAVDAAKSTTLGFDELNVIENKNPISNMFKTVAVDAERAEASMLKFQQILSGVGLVGVGGLSLKALLGLKEAEVIDLDIGSIMLKAAGVGLTVSGGFDFLTAVADAINNGGMSDQNDIQSAMGLVKVGGGLSLMTASPIPIAIALVAQFGFTGKFVGNLAEELKENVNKPIKEWVGGFDSWVDSLNLPPIIAALFKNNAVSLMIDWVGTITEGATGLVEGFTGALYNLFHGNWEEFWESGKEMWLGQMEIIVSPLITIFSGLRGLFEGVVNTIIDGINVVIRGINNIPGVDIEQLSHVNWTTDGSETKGTQTGFASGAIHGVSGELGLDQDQYRYGPQMGSSEPIQIYLDGKQIYGAVRRAELVSGSRVARGLLAE